MNILAIALATISNFVLGGLWYSLLFGKIWQKEANISFEQIQSNPIRPYFIAFICSLLAALGFDYLVANSASLENNLILGLIIGGFVATSLCINYQFAARSIKLFLIDAGYHVARFIIYAIIFWYIQ